MGFTGWAVSLNGVMIQGGCDHGQEAWDESDCGQNPMFVVDRLTAPPEGLGLPGLRNQDTTYAGRDGSVHFNDYYEPRVITLQATIGPNDDCAECTSTRRQLSELIKAWRRSCCDIELVIHTPCDGDVVIGTPILGPQVVRRNLVRNPSFEEDLEWWTVPDDTLCRTYDRCYTEDGGTTWCYSTVIDGVFTETRETDGGYSGDAYMRLTCDTEPTSAGMGFTYAPPAPSELDVTTGEAYVSSAYLRSSVAMKVAPQVLWYDSVGNMIGVSVGETVELSDIDTWTRVSMEVVAPEGVSYARLQWITTDVDDWVVGATLDIDAAMFELGTELLDYFDGDTPDINDPPEVGGVVTTNFWYGNVHDSISVQSEQVWEENIDRTLVGPVGIIGRPRVASYQWRRSKKQIADVILAFVATDQRMYLLDECGTPGYQKCRTITPGLQQRCRSYDLCYTDGGRCYTAQSSTSNVIPVTASVGGTERVYPLIVLNPGLSYPTIENMDSSEFITFNGITDSEAILIDTYNGIATGQVTGQSYTHLLGGSVFLSMVPGENQFRMITSASADDGTASLCWRDTVVSI